MKTHSNSIRTLATEISRYVGALLATPSKVQMQVIMFGVGVTLFVCGTLTGAMAAEPDGDDLTATFNDTRIANAVNMLLTYLEGSFGALVMVVSGIGAIMSAAFGQYKAALGCLVVAVGSFILRSFISTFFNEGSIRGGG
jgi:hypothetical protein